MKKNFTKAVLLALTVVSMGMFNSCKDHDDCNINGIELDNLENVVNEQKDEIEARIEALKKVIEDIKQCNCTLTPEQVEQMIKDAIESGDNEAFVTAVENIINGQGFQTEADVTETIKEFLAANPAGLTKEEIQELINTATEKFATQEALDNAVATLEKALK